MLRGHVSELVVTHAYERRQGPKDDQRDAFHLADSLRLGSVSPVYKHAGQLSELRAHADVYAKLVTDVVRAQDRLKALFRSRGVQVVGAAVYTQRDRQTYLSRLARPYQGSAQLLYSELDALRGIKKENFGHRVGHVEKQGGLPPRALPTDTLAAACTGKASA